jgi:hypothetical protein
VRRAAILFTMMMSVVACESTTDPLDGIGGGGGGLTAAQATGNWTFTLVRTTTFACAGALASGQPISAHLDVSTDGTLSQNSTWQNPLSGAVEPLSGSVGFDGGALDLIFAAGGSAMELFPGTMKSGGTVTGATITDPAAGSAQVFGTGACQYTVSATKTG